MSTSGYTTLENNRIIFSYNSLNVSLECLLLYTVVIQIAVKPIKNHVLSATKSVTMQVNAVAEAHSEPPWFSPVEYYVREYYCCFNSTLFCDTFAHRAFSRSAETPKIMQVITKLFLFSQINKYDYIHVTFLRKLICSIFFNFLQSSSRSTSACSVRASHYLHSNMSESVVSDNLEIPSFMTIYLYCSESQSF